MEKFTSHLQRSGESIQKEIAAAFKTLPHALPILASEYELFIQSARGGKHIRGMLVQLGYSLANPLENKDVVKVSAAFEILHASLLIHDDVIDRSPTRRGKATIHEALGGAQYGMSQAICLGDMGFFLATELIAKSDFPSSVKVKLIGMFSRMVMDTIAGEMLDVKISLPDYPKEKGDILSMQRLKTASYTIVGPLLAGAILGRTTVAQQRAIRQYGERIGMAFQIQDDILGVFGDEVKIGKSVTSDIEENKSTLLIVEALKNAAPEQREILERFYGKGKITASQHNKIRKIFEDTGSLTSSMQMVEKYIVEGKKYIPKMTKDKNVQFLLTQFSDFIFQRQK